MTTLRITIGAPGSGKTTGAVLWVSRDPAHRARINRDDLRAMMHGGYLGNRAQEDQVTAARDAMITKLLRNGISVVADDTNLRWAHVERLRRLASRVQVDFEIVSYLDIPIDVCIRRDRERTPSLGEKIIVGMWANGIRDQIDNWRSRVVEDLTKMGHTNPADMVDNALADPTGHDSGPVVILARQYTNQRIAQYAPHTAVTFQEAA